MPWVKEQLEQDGYTVIEPAMPHTDRPVIHEWVAHLAAVVTELNEHTYFVGHSVGCQAIMRYLATINQKVGGCVFVAGWFKLDNMTDEEEIRLSQPWLQDDIDFTAVLQTTTNFVVINSSNDDYGYVAENKELFEKKLGATVKILENRGHLTAADGVTQLPEVVTAIQGFARKI